MVFRFLFFFSLVLTTNFATAQHKKPITHEAMWLLKRVGAPAVSPDGKLVIFSVTEPAYDEKEQITDLWITTMDGAKAPRRLTSAKGGESGYTWSPDGTKIAFSAKRDGDEVSQIYLLNMAEGGDAQRFTKLSSGAGGAQFSPDGQKMMFTSSVYPMCYQDSLQKKAAEEKKKLKYNARVYESFPVRNWDKWLDEKQTHLYIQDLHPDSTARNLFQGMAMSKIAGFRFGSATWSGDSKSVVFDATRNANTTAYQDESEQLFQVNISGGEATALTSETSDYSSPRMSKDGKTLFCTRSAPRQYEVYTLSKLVRFDYPSMRNETAMNDSLDRAVNGYFAEGDQMIMGVENMGRERIYIIPISGGRAELFDRAERGCIRSMSAASNATGVWAAQYESAFAPPEIVRILPDGNIKPLTFFNRDTLATLDLGGVEEIWTTSSRGKKIRSLVIKPAGFDPKKQYPLFVVMHGGPASSYMENWSFRWNYHLLAAPGYVLLCTDYTGSTGYGEAFSRAIKGDPFEGPGQEINEAATDAIKRFSFIDPKRQAAGGASYGGHLANWMQATTSHYKCLISHAGLMNSVSQWGSSDYIWGREIMNGGTPWSGAETWQKQNPIRFADQFKTPMLITIGEQDFRVPLNNSLESWHVHQRLKIPSKLIVFPEENHWVNKGENSKFFYAELAAWLKKWL
jgi:dipeptidyl aminopeptidase/acylaminoacyl peptidase